MASYNCMTTMRIIRKGWQVPNPDLRNRLQGFTKAPYVYATPVQRQPEKEGDPSLIWVESISTFGFKLCLRELKGAFHLVKISGISGSAVNGTRFVGSSHWKIPRKSGKSKRWSRFPGWNFRTECRVPLTFLVVCTSSRSTVGHPVTYRGLRPNGTTFYRSEVPLLLPPKFPGFFRKWKAPRNSQESEKTVLVIRFKSGKTLSRHGSSRLRHKNAKGY